MQGETSSDIYYRVQRLQLNYGDRVKQAICGYIFYVPSFIPNSPGLMKGYMIWLLPLALACFNAGAQPNGNVAVHYKVSPALQLYLDHPQAGTAKDSGWHYYKVVCADSTALFCLFSASEKNKILKRRFPYYHSYVMEIRDFNLLRKIVQLPSVSLVDFYKAPAEELEVSNYDPSLNRIHLLHNQYPLANGSGLTISIKEQIFDTLDIDFRGRYVKSSTESATYSGHASIMATLAGGAGNTSSGSLGVSPGVNLTSSDFSNLFPDPDAIFEQNGISVQNHSYGIGIENYYGPEARAYDLQLNARATLAHVFSVGNSGLATPETGRYAGIKGFANTTGNFKTAKNIISVAATDSFFRVPSAISKGPAFDGRLKPELAAFGEDGSSGAAAIVSGTIIALQHLYKQLYGTLPHASLLRAVLFNSAEDIGAPGIDYASGYGSLNAVKAADHIAKGLFFTGSLHQGDTVSFSVAIPVGIQRAKFTLAWNDPAAALLAVKGLVNDADMEVVRLADGTSFQPWVLSHFPHADSLNQLPVRRRDTINNAEQVSIENPPAGTYLIRILGSSIDQGPQTFHVAYQLDSIAGFEFVYPVQNTVLTAGRIHTVRWRSAGTGTGTLSYSPDNVNWHTIADGVELSAGYYQWQVPETFSVVRLKMSSPNEVVSDSFVISPQPALQIGFDCPADFMLYWNKMHPAAAYELFRLGDKYMEPFAVQTDTLAVLLKSASPSSHYALRALLPGGKASQRSYAYNYATQGVECYVKAFLAELSGEVADLTLTLGTVYGIRSLLIEKQTMGGYALLQQVDNPAELEYKFTDRSLQTGLNIYRVRILRTGGGINEGNQAFVYYFGRQPYLVYPNPVPPGGTLHVVASDLNNAVFRLYNMAGQLVLNYGTRVFDEQVPMAKLQAGLYFYTIAENGQIVQRGKIMIL